MQTIIQSLSACKWSALLWNLVKQQCKSQLPGDSKTGTVVILMYWVPKQEFTEGPFNQPLQYCAEVLTHL